jgi:hypothetical protein
MSRELTKKTTALEKLLAEKVKLDAEINSRGQELRMLRIAAIRGDDDPGELPQFAGLDDQQRSSQLKREGIERSNHEIEMSPEQQAGLRQLADMAAEEAR